jgi:hypothetical protein
VPLAPVKIWSGLSSSGEKLKTGTNKATSYLGKAAIGESIRNRINLEKAKQKAERKSALHKKSFESDILSAGKRVKKINASWNRELPFSLRGSDQNRQLAEKYLRAANQAYESGRKEDFKKLMRKAKQQKELYKKGKL